MTLMVGCGGADRVPPAGVVAPLHIAPSMAHRCDEGRSTVRQPCDDGLARRARRRVPGIEPMVWPRSPGCSPQGEHTRKLGLPAAGNAVGDRHRADSDDTCIDSVGVDDNDEVAGASSRSSRS